MNIKFEQLNSILVITIAEKKLDAGNSKEVKDLLLSRLNENSRAVFDLSGLTFIDSSGLSVLISCLKKVVQSGGDIKICGMQKPVQALFELVKMHKVFDIFSGREEAVAALG